VTSPAFRRTRNRGGCASTDWLLVEIVNEAGQLATRCRASPPTFEARSEREEGATERFAARGSRGTATLPLDRLGRSFHPVTSLVIHLTGRRSILDVDLDVDRQLDAHVDGIENLGPMSQVSANLTQQEQQRA